jgi:hypothetical protein
VELLSLKPALLSSSTAVSMAQDEVSEPRRLLARERKEGEIRVRREGRDARELKGDIQEAEACVARMHSELQSAEGRKGALEERV